MSDEYRFLFVGDIPILYPKSSIARQIEVEIYLDKAFLKMLGLKFKEDYKEAKIRGYIS